MNISHGYRILHIAETDSTNAEARRLITNGESGDRLLLWTDYQLAGKGQAGNHWESERGKNLLFTLCLQPSELLPQDQFLLSEITSLAVCTALNEIVQGFTIKWPNDIYYENKKVCGILIEHILTSSKILQSFIGIGINVNQKNFLSDATNPVSIAQIIGKTIERRMVLDTFLHQFHDYRELLLSGQTATIEQTYRKWLFRKDGMHTYRDKDGEFHARIMNIGHDGQLILEDSIQQVRCYAFKEVEFVL